MKHIIAFMLLCLPPANSIAETTLTLVSSWNRQQNFTHLFMDYVDAVNEAAAFGALSVVLLAAAFRCLSFDALRRSLLSTVSVTGMVFLLIIGSSVFSQLLAFSGASGAIIDWSVGIDTGVLPKLLLMFAVLLALGMFMDQISILLITMLGVAPKGTTLPQVAFAAAPYLVSDAVLLGMLIAVPAIALYLPGFL